MSVRTNPTKGQVYTLKEIYTGLYLRDSAFLKVDVGNRTLTVQDHWSSIDEVLSDQAVADSRWTYVRETSEWIPIFKAHGDVLPLLAAVIDDDDEMHDGGYCVVFRSQRSEMTTRKSVALEEML